MSLFKSYTPKNLYLGTLRLVNALFHEPPRIKSTPTSYFREVLNIHALIREDLNGVLKEIIVPENSVTVEQVHASLVSIEQQLFGIKSDFDADLRGCCLYTKYLEKQLSTSSSCVII
tara:strand:- start:1138 stop:1488 length:351 start_codon:yes stop_codon:yes gene_type:complete